MLTRATLPNVRCAVAAGSPFTVTVPTVVRSLDDVPTTGITGLGPADIAAAAQRGERVRLLGTLERSRLKHVLAAHLSAQNNKPGLAREALARAMGCAPDWIGISTQDEGFAWRELK